ncbi:TPA: hypothetical protein EYP66_01745 [Candidatus Poribacteria bacterium]|nr:hypothetical protein [Candidatus Poribacteria bacterium]
MKIIEINLLPPEETPESPYGIRNIAILVLSFVIIFWLILLALQVNSLKNEYVRRKEKVLQKLAVYRIQKQKIDKLQKKKADLEERYKLITEVLGQRITWYDKLSVMHRQIPEDTWLSQVSMEIQQAEELQKEMQKSILTRKKTSRVKDLEKNVQPSILIHISGYTSELPKVGELIANLEHSPLFEKTRFTKIGNTEINARSAISFEIVTQVSGLRSNR